MPITLAATEQHQQSNFSFLKESEVEFLKQIERHGNLFAIAEEYGVAIAVVSSKARAIEAKGLVEEIDDEYGYRLTSEGIKLVSAAALPKDYQLQQLESEIFDLAENIRLGFYEIGKRLRKIREEELYKTGNPDRTFAQYCEERFNFKANYAYKQIAASQVFDDIEPVCNTGTEYLYERLLRPLADEKFDTESRQEIWQEAESLAEEGDREEVKTTDVTRAIAIWQEERAQRLALPPLETGTFCKVILKGSSCPEVKPFKDKIVKILGKADIGDNYRVATFGNIPAQTYLKREELAEVSEDSSQSFRVEIPMSHYLMIWEFAAKNESTVIAQLVEDWQKNKQGATSHPPANNFSDHQDSINPEVATEDQPTEGEEE